MNNKIKIITGIGLALVLASCGTKGEAEKSSLTSSTGGKTEQTSEIPNKGNNREETIQRAKEVISCILVTTRMKGSFLFMKKARII